jgi:23S rRNA-/tRNA-specific pseudouridylate synthase
MKLSISELQPDLKVSWFHMYFSSFRELIFKKKSYRYKVREVFAGGGSALVEWRLETGRTHQVIIP